MWRYAQTVIAPDGGGMDLGWALHTVVRLYRRRTDSLLEDVPGGPRGYQVLMTAQRGPRRSQLALAQYLGIDRTMMTYLLDDLECAGLVERQADPGDRRIRHVVVTQKGSDVLCGARRRIATAEESMLTTLGPEQAKTLRTLLYDLAARSEPDAHPADISGR